MKLKKLLFMLLVILGSISLIGCNDDRIQIGILQFVEHEALSEARRGFIDGLAEAGFVDGENIKITLYNPQTDPSTMTQQAQKLIRKSNLVLGIATPAAQALANAAEDLGKDTPILFTAVTDPVDAKLVTSNESPGGNITGTNDMNPIVEQISLIKELLPTATKLGIIHTASEPNSELQATLAKEEAEKEGLVVTIKKITAVTDLEQVANQLASSVDVLYIPTDNTIVASMGIINEVVMQNGIPAIVGEPNAVDGGGSITYGIDYYKLGKLTAEMAVQILADGKLPKDIPSIGLSEYSLIINKKQLDEIGVEVPQSLLDKADRVIE